MIDMRAHMDGSEFAHWIGLSELRNEAREAATAKAKSETPARPALSRSFSHKRRR